MYCDFICLYNQSIPPTMPVITFVVHGTRLSCPFHGTTHCRNARTSSWSLRLKTSEDVIITKDSSVSRCEDREFKFVDPKRDRIGAELGVGESHMPWRVQFVIDWCFGRQIWKATFGMIRPTFLAHSFNWIPLSSSTDQFRLAAFTALMNRCSRRVYPSGIRPERPGNP